MEAKLAGMTASQYADAMEEQAICTGRRRRTCPHTPGKGTDEPDSTADRAATTYRLFVDGDDPTSRRSRR
jgi:hypothetical protein